MERKPQRDEIMNQPLTEDAKYQQEIIWTHVFAIFAIHATGLYALLNLHKVMTHTILWGIVIYLLSGLGVTAGAHRYWCHRSYQAKLPLRIFLFLCHSMSYQSSLFEWVRDHRTHHKFSETDADPHNSLRGFFFCHVGWLMVKKHPDVLSKGKTVGLSDLYDDQIVMFQRKYFKSCIWSMSVILPTVVPLLWGETMVMSFLMNALRYCVVVNVTWSINSVAHMWGDRPYDKNIKPVDNLFVSLFGLGEGFHNYHHVFPYDYSSSELGTRFNVATAFIDLMAYVGLATNLRKVSPELLKARIQRTGQCKD